MNNSLTTADLIIEIGMEELPPLSLNKLSNAFASSIEQQLHSSSLKFDSITSYSSSRRLAIIIKALALTQPDTVASKTGPTLAVAFNEDGTPTKAAAGFARGCGVSVDQLSATTAEPQKLLFEQTIKGAPCADLLQPIVTAALEQLPVEKPMRWGANEFEFVRPVHWVLALLGDSILPLTLFGITASNCSYGHRFHHPDAIIINSADDYVDALRHAMVLVDGAERRQSIIQQIDLLAAEKNATALKNDSLNEEINGLVEYPVALIGSFDSSFLEVPQAVLISSMQSHQKYFPLVDSDNKLLPYFITVANIQSSSPETVIKGNQRVIRPRLSDASFFYHNDCDKTLSYYAERLDNFTFERQLGSMAAKVGRIAQLTTTLAKTINHPELIDDLTRAAYLCKADLLSDMVQEFPDLQGEMGGHYALAQGENQQVSSAIAEHYLPRFVNDDLPSTLAGTLLSLADRVDTLVGIFAIGKQPSGSRDPFALRRHSFAIIRMIIDSKLDIDLSVLITSAIDNAIDNTIDNPVDSTIEFSSTLPTTIVDYLLERLRHFFDEHNIDSDIFSAINALGISHPIDFKNRADALMTFKKLAVATELSQAHKRVSNILKKNKEQLGSFDDNPSVDPSLLIDAEEQALFKAMNQLDIKRLIDAKNYADALTAIASINAELNLFFDKVMVMSDDLALRTNRLKLLLLLSRDLSAVADIGLLD